MAIVIVNAMSIVCVNTSTIATYIEYTIIKQEQWGQLECIVILDTRSACMYYCLR